MISSRFVMCRGRRGTPPTVVYKGAVMMIAHRTYMGVKIIIDDNMDIYDDVPVRFHKRPRIQKKWRERFGTKRVLVSSDVYYIQKQQAYIMSRKTYRLLEKEADKYKSPAYGGGEICGL